jgi:site-specific DNA-methyltransferase (adenine-specific)
MMIGEIVQGDCIELMQEIPQGSVDMILCDLPYGVTANEKDRPLDLGKLWSEYRRVTKPSSAIVLTAQFPFSADLVNSNRKMFRYDLIWDKMLVSGHLNANRMPMRVHEHILVFYKKRPTYNPQFTEGQPRHSEGMAVGKGVVHQNYGRWNRVSDTKAGETRKHPRSIIAFQKPHPSVALHRTEKPIALFEWLVRTYTNPGDVVLDNCIGSGTTAVVCKNTSRRFIDIDSDPDCVALAKSRLAEIPA